MAANLKKDAWFLRKIKNKEITVTKKGVIYNNKTKKAIGSSQGEYIRIGIKNHLTGKIMVILAHRLVWIAYNGLIKNPNLQINHKDGIKTNNYLSNLELVTNSDNVKHGYVIGTNKISEKFKILSSKRMKGEKNPNSKFSDKNVSILRKKFLKGKIDLNYICKKYNVSKKSAINMLVGDTYSHVDGKKCDKDFFPSNGVGAPPKFSKKDIEKMVELRKSGLSVKEVSLVFNTHSTTVSKKTSHYFT